MSSYLFWFGLCLFMVTCQTAQCNIQLHVKEYTVTCKRSTNTNVIICLCKLYYAYYFDAIQLIQIALPLECVLSPNNALLIQDHLHWISSLFLIDSTNAMDLITVMNYCSLCSSHSEVDDHCPKKKSAWNRVSDKWNNDHSSNADSTIRLQLHYHLIE